MLGLEDHQSKWKLAAKIAAWLTGLVATFIVSPPMLTTPDSTNFLLRFSQFVFAVLVGLYFLGPSSVSRQRWRRISVGLLATGFALFVAYVWLTSLWSCQYDDVGKLVIGGQLSPEARAYVARQGQATCKQLLMAADGESDRVWSRDGLIFRYLLMSVTYTVAILSLSSAAMAMLQSLDQGAPRVAAPGGGGRAEAANVNLVGVSPQETEGEAAESDDPEPSNSEARA